MVSVFTCLLIAIHKVSAIEERLGTTLLWAFSPPIDEHAVDIISLFFFLCGHESLPNGENAVGISFL